MDSVQLTDGRAVWCAICGRLVVSVGSNGTLTVTRCSEGHEVTIRSAFVPVPAEPVAAEPWTPGRHFI